MRKYILAGIALPLLLFCIASMAFAGNCGSDKTPYDRLISVEKWKVNLHMVYNNNRSNGSTEHAVSDWTGVLDIQEADIGQWYNRGGLDVKVDGVAEINAGECHNTIVAQGTEKYGFSLYVHKDGYVIGQGYCNTQFGKSTMRCPKDVHTSDGSITYSQPWQIKTPLPEQGTTLSGEATFTHDRPSKADRPLEKGATIKVKWELTPVKERELKYKETTMDVAAMTYPGTAVDPHVFVFDPLAGKSSWMPHANFAGELWVDGVNKVNIRTGAGPAPTDKFGRRQNVTSEYMISRVVRQTDKNGKVILNWHPDITDPIQDWIDNPAATMVAGPPSTWGSLHKEVMDEFLVQVMRHPEIGYIYAAFALETRKNAYRIYYSPPTFLSEEEYKNIKASSKPCIAYPFTKESGGWIELVQDQKTKKWHPKPLK